MLHLIYGNDRQKGRERFQALRDKLASHGARIEGVREGSVSRETLEGMTASRGLFGEVPLFVFDAVLEKKAEQELVVSCAQMLAESPNFFLIYEPTLAKEFVDDIARCADEITDCSIKKVENRPAFNIFALGDALGTRNKKDLWILFQKAQDAGVEPEEICGTLFWSVKNMALMKSAQSGDDAGLNPFVAKKARGFSTNYSGNEIAGLSRTLMRVYHEAHRGGEPMAIALERFILSL